MLDMGFDEEVRLFAVGIDSGIAVKRIEGM